MSWTVLGGRRGTSKPFDVVAVLFFWGGGGEGGIEKSYVVTF